MNNYGEKLRRIIGATGWSQEFLANKLDTSFVTLNSWINDKSIPRESAKERIDLVFADVLGADDIDKDKLVELKKRANACKYTAKKLITEKPLLEKLTTSLTYHSNGTEGSTMTEQDVAAVIYGNQTLKNRSLMEQREAINHQTALYYLLDELIEKGKDFCFTPDVIKATHLRLMNGIVPDAGYYRNHGVRIRGSSVPLANYMKISELIENWCNLANEETIDKIELMARTHAEFERIHPFSDGNGRTGRLMLFVLALKLGLVPPVLRKEKRFAYYKYLELAQTREITDPLEMYIAEAIIDTAEQIE
ncbi:Fic family protein [Candidatus Saccharibacteria bacterium]|nr:Fic family protein [Candidatus Saccharibacteria bacterium]